MFKAILYWFFGIFAALLNVLLVIVCLIILIIGWIITAPHDLAVDILGKGDDKK